MPDYKQTFNFGKLAQKVAPSNNIVYFRKGPQELSLNVTNACPNACVFCIRDRDEGWGVSNLYLAKEPSTADIISAFNSHYDSILAQGEILEKVKICGYGEPIMRCRELPEVLRAIRSRFSQAIQLTTTGWPYFAYISQEPSDLRALVGEGLTHVYLSMSAPNEKVYRRLVRPMQDYEGQAFDDSLRFGLMAKILGLDVTLGFINLAGVDKKEVMELAKRMGMNYRIREMEE
jgi:TatD family-associated radical SAM protein